MPHDERSNAAGTALLMFTLGAASGAIVALLCAPAKGQESREYLRRRAREAGDQAAAAAAKARDLVQQSAEAVVTSIDEWRSTVAGALEDGHQFVEQAKDTVANAVEQGRDAYQQAKGRGQA